MEKKLYQGGVFGALLTDLSKAFGCIPHDLIIATLEACCLEIDALRLIHAYLINFWCSPGICTRPFAL